MTNDRLARRESQTVPPLTCVPKVWALLCDKFWTQTDVICDVKASSSDGPLVIVGIMEFYTFKAVVI